jgi:hypothetical protein
MMISRKGGETPKYRKEESVMKKFVALLLAMALVLSLCAFAQAEEITLRVLAGQSTTDAGIEDMIDEALAKK